MFGKKKTSPELSEFQGSIASRIPAIPSLAGRPFPSGQQATDANNTSSASEDDIAHVFDQTNGVR